MLKLRIQLSEAATPKLVGMIRQGSALIRIYSAQQIKKENLRATAISAEGAPSEQSSRVIPLQLCDNTSHWHKTLKAICDEEVHFTDICISLNDLTDALSIQIGDIQHQEFEWLDSRLSLERLQTPDFRFFYKFFTFKSNRHLDVETVFYVSRANLLTHKIAPEIYVNSSVIFCYKALELKGKDLHNAEAFLLNALKKTNQFSAITGSDSNAAGIRSDPVAAKLSIYTALLHLYLFQGNFEKINDVVNTVENTINTTPFDNSYAYNVSRIYMAGGIISTIQMNKKLAEYRLNLVIDLFYRAVSTRIPVKQMHRFAELAAPLGLATHAMRLLNLEFPYPTIMLKKTMPLISRISDADYVTSISNTILTHTPG